MHVKPDLFLSREAAERAATDMIVRNVIKGARADVRPCTRLAGDRTREHGFTAGLILKDGTYRQIVGSAH